MGQKLRIHLLAPARHFLLVALHSIRVYISGGRRKPTKAVSQNSHLALKARHIAQTFHGLFVSNSPEVNRLPYRSCFNQGCRNTNYGNHEDAHCIVIVLVKGPEDQARNLENIERMKCLR